MLHVTRSLVGWQTELREELQSLLGFNQQVQLVVEQLEDTCRSIQVRWGRSYQCFAVCVTDQQECVCVCLFTQEGCKTQRQSVCDDLQRVCSLLEERQKVSVCECVRLCVVLLWKCNAKAHLLCTQI